jgi:hypothetical protein
MVEEIVGFFLVYDDGGGCMRVYDDGGRTRVYEWHPYTIGNRLFKRHKMQKVRNRIYGVNQFIEGLCALLNPCLFVHVWRNTRDFPWNGTTNIPQ